MREYKDKTLLKDFMLDERIRLKTDGFANVASLQTLTGTGCVLRSPSG